MGWDFAKPEELEINNIPYLLRPTDQEKALFLTKDNELAGGIKYRENERFNELVYTQVMKRHRGERINDDPIAQALFRQLEENLPQKPVRSVATSMEGKIQHLRQREGFEAAGFYLNNYKTRLTSETRPEDPTSGGFDTELWKGVDETVEMYMPSELQDFAEKSLENQRDIRFLEPQTDQGSKPSLSLKLREQGERDGGGERNKVLRTEIKPGEEGFRSVLEEVEMLEDDSVYWAHQVELDPSIPETYKAAEQLYNSGYRPTNLKPSAEGSKLFMTDLNTSVGFYSLTPDTMKLVEASGLNYEVVENEDTEKSNYLAFHPLK